jgi:hypothetical protein
LQTLGVDSTQVLKVFAVDATGAGTPRDQVMEDIAKTAGQQPHVYVLMVKERPELTVVHREHTQSMQVHDLSIHLVMLVLKEASAELGKVVLITT